VSIGWAATVFPFLSHYRTAAIGFGTIAVDLGAAVLLTSVLRHRLGLRAWRAVHWLAYLAWPAAFYHALSAAGGDLRIGLVAATIWGSAAATAAAVTIRLAAAARRRPGPHPGAARRELHEPKPREPREPRELRGANR
jgi:sulfoxide reductase heme-binding subunit YedZ